MATKFDKTSQRSTATEKEISAITPLGPVGLDVGTSHVVVAQNERNHVDTIKQLNAFFTIPKSKFAKSILEKNNILHFELDNLFYIFGFSAENFAKMFNTSTRRAIKNGILSADEKDSVHVVQSLILSLIQKPKRFGETICFGVPGEPLKGTGSVVYHEAIMKRFLMSLGYTPVSINEGMAVVISELSQDDYTGIGISMGGGMCNICLSYLSFPVITYSVQKAGDYIDKMVGLSVAEPATKIKSIKEQSLDLYKEPKDRVTTALHIFYEDVINNLLDSLQRVLSSTDQIPVISKPIPIVISGGTSMPPGFKEKFEKSLKRFTFPVEISQVRLAEDMLNTTAKGALIMAMTEAK
ncbi:MAG: hypothetical protein HQK76_13000 [Desulfobacterales bacterium]|nr:hypothetical protein [Desulfobacterales bacterium]